MEIQVQAIARHRNGITGAPFDVILFIDEANGPMLAVVFDKECHCAVLHRDMLAAGDIKFASNSWRGDWYEPQLREAIMALEAGQIPSRQIMKPKNERRTSKAKHRGNA